MEIKMPIVFKDSLKCLSIDSYAGTLQIRLREQSTMDTDKLQTA